jgi:hypothetical protein
VSGLDALVERYVAAWNENEPMRRRKRVADLWHETAVRYNHTSEQVGREAIAQAVISTYQHFGANGYRFTPLNNTVAHHNAVKFSWEMVTPSGETDSIGTTFLLLDHEGRIALDYQFTETVPPPAV